jgi:hypothetical protein
MPKIALAKVAMGDRSELLPMTICAVLVLAGGIGASIVSAINITPPYADILLIAALFVAVIPIFPIAVWLGAMWPGLNKAGFAVPGNRDMPDKET